jgi:hypothetical protein
MASFGVRGEGNGDIGPAAGLIRPVATYHNWQIDAFPRYCDWQMVAILQGAYLLLAFLEPAICRCYQSPNASRFGTPIP